MDFAFGMAPVEVPSLAIFHERPAATDSPEAQEAFREIQRRNDLYWQLTELVERLHWQVEACQRLRDWTDRACAALVAGRYPECPDHLEGLGEQLETAAWSLSLKSCWAY